jgi:hypothetical protein
MKSEGEMMRHVFLKLSMPLLIVFTVVGLAARAVGTTQPTHPALRGFTEGCEGKPQPCWYGIVPGMTSMADGRAGLLRAGYRIDKDSDSTVTFLPPADSMLTYAAITKQVQSDRIGTAFLWPNGDFRLGDAIFLWGYPSGVQTFNFDFAALLFQQNQVKLVFNAFRDFSPKLGNMRLIALFGGNVLMSNLPWQGFISTRRFCQLEVADCFYK